MQFKDVAVSFRRRHEYAQNEGGGWETLLKLHVEIAVIFLRDVGSAAECGQLTRVRVTLVPAAES